LPPRIADRRFPAWTAGNRGLPPEFFRAVPAGRTKRLGHVRRVPSPRRSRCGVKPPPASTLTSGLAVGTNTAQQFYRDLGIVGPSRPRRSPRPAVSPGTGPDANLTSRRQRSFSCSTSTGLRRRALGVLRSVGSLAAALQAAQAEGRASSITRRSVDILAAGSRQARCPARAMAAGIVAASMARRGQSTFKRRGGCICPNCQAVSSERRLRPVGAGFEGRRAPQGWGRRACALRRLTRASCLNGARSAK